MQWLRNLSIKFKILLIVLVAMCGFIVTLSFNYVTTSANTIRLAQVKDVYFPVLEHANSNIVRLDKIKEALNAAVSTGEDELIEEAGQYFESSIAAYNEILVLNPENKVEIEQLKLMIETYFNNAKTLTEGMISGSIPPEQINPSVEKMMVSLNNYSGALNAFHKQQHAGFTGTIHAIDEAASSTLTIGLAIGLVSMLLIASISTFVISVITRNIHRVVETLMDISLGNGDLTKRLESKSNDEIGEMVKHFNIFMDKLQNIIGSIFGSTSQLTSVAENLATLSTQSSAGLDRQNKDISAVAAAITQMSTTVQEVSRNATQAATAANDATAASDRGDNVVRETISTINQSATEGQKVYTALHDLQESSEDVGGVLDVIRGVAEQINLLALNAAIEAARAGEHGRGFAVVADEIRTLANRTQLSTQEIQSIIVNLQGCAAQAVEIMEESKVTTERGVVQAVEAGKALEEIDESINLITGMNSQIACAAEEQSTAADEINKNVVSISQVSEQAGHSANQLKDSSVKLESLARELTGQVAQFKV